MFFFRWLKLILHDFSNDLNSSAWKCFLESFLPLKPSQMTLFQLLLFFVLMSLRILSPSTSSPSLAARPQPRPILDPEAETNALEAELNRGGSRDERRPGWERRRAREGPGPDLADGKRGIGPTTERRARRIWASGQDVRDFSESFLSNTCLTFVPLL